MVKAGDSGRNNPKAMKTTEREIGAFLEAKAKIGDPIYYADVIKQFPDLPQLGPYWRSHPLSDIFGNLDDDDQANGRPFRTALVISKDRNTPGQGFFDAMRGLRKMTILESDQIKIWLDELEALRNFYKEH